MKRASLILIHKGMINGELHLYQNKNKQETDEKNKAN